MNFLLLSRCTATPRKFSASPCSISRIPSKCKRRYEPPPRPVPSPPSVTSPSDRLLKGKLAPRYSLLRLTENVVYVHLQIESCGPGGDQIPASGRTFTSAFKGRFASRVGTASTWKSGDDGRL